MKIYKYTKLEDGMIKSLYVMDIKGIASIDDIDINEWEIENTSSGREIDSGSAFQPDENMKKIKQEIEDNGYCIIISELLKYSASR